MVFANALGGLVAAADESWLEQLLPDGIEGTVLTIIIVAAVVIVVGLILFFILRGYFAEVKKIKQSTNNAKAKDASNAKNKNKGNKKGGKTGDKKKKKK